MKLKLAEDLSLPIDAVTEKLAFLGRTGSGKTYAAMKLAELMLAAGAQVGAIDPVGVWRALRVPAKPGGQSFEVVVFGGLYGDLPLAPTAGELIADLVCDRGLSFVLDVSQFIPAEQQRFVRAFADRFFHRKKAAPSAVHLFLEECQEFIPENPSGEEARTLGVMQRLWKLGRNFGIGGSLISQRPQEIAKKALNMSGTLFAFQMTGPQERKAIRAWVADHGVAVDIERVLQKLEVGQPHVESPMFLEVSATVRVLPRVTADLSSTPKVLGGAAPAKRALTPIDVEQLKTSMAATIEQAKANDPVELRKANADKDKRIRELEAALSKGVHNMHPKVQPKVVEKPALTEKDRQVLAAWTERLQALDAALVTDTQKIVDEVGRKVAAAVNVASADMVTLLTRTEGEAQKPLRTAQVQRVLEKIAALQAPSRPAPPPAPRTTIALDRGLQQRVREVVTPRAAPPAGGNGHGTLSPKAQQILNALAELEQLGAREPERELVALLSGYTNLTSKGFVNAMSALSSGGYVRYPNSGQVALTDTGRGVAVPPEAPRSAADVQRRICDLLGGKSAEILRPVIEAYPNALPRTDVAAAAGYTNLTSKGFVNAISRLRTLGFVDYPDTGSIVAMPVLFLEGR